LDRKYKPAPKIWAEEEHFKIHNSVFHEELIPKIEILLAGKTDPEKVLNNFIMERTREAENQ
jgi:hypothetical protein